MASLPTVGADTGTWGTELNEYLLVDHNADGTHPSSATDPDLVTIAGLSPSNDDLLQRKAGAWANRTPAQVKTDLVLAKADVGLGSADNTSDVGKPVSTAQQAALDLKAPLASPAFTGTPTGITKSHVGLGSVDNTADTAKPVSTTQQTALDLKAPLASPTFTGSIVTPIVAGDGTTVKLRPEGAADDDGELRVTNGAAGTALTFVSADGSTADVIVRRSGANVLLLDASIVVASSIYCGGSVLLGPLDDVNLYRSAANVLKTDDSLEVVGTLTVGGLPVTGGAGGASFVSAFKWGVDA